MVRQYWLKTNRPHLDADAGEVLVEFDGREITYGFGELDELVLAYAITIHKPQGWSTRPW